MSLPESGGALSSSMAEPAADPDFPQNPKLLYTIGCPRRLIRGQAQTFSSGEISSQRSEWHGPDAMIGGSKICVVLPAYNAARTLERTVREIPTDVVDDIILVDDASADETARLARELGLFTFVHDGNRGYGANQKTCYRLALSRGADIVIMLHPDYQYSPKLLHPIALLLSSGYFDVVLGSRILGVGALAGGMPLYKYISNRLLTLIQNLLTGHRLSEYHTGYRGFTRAVIEDIPLDRNSDDFVFDNQMLSQIIYRGFRVGEISCPTRYFPEASSINFRRSVAYGLGVLKTAVQFRLSCWGLDKGTVFEGLKRRRSFDAPQEGADL